MWRNCAEQTLCAAFTEHGPVVLTAPEERQGGSVPAKACEWLLRNDCAKPVAATVTTEAYSAWRALRLLKEFSAYVDQRAI